MGTNNRFSIPPTKGEVQKKMLNPKFQADMPSVEEARAAMIAAAEPATTVKGGSKVPKFVQEAQESRGVGGNTPLVEVQVEPVTVHAPQNEVSVPTQPARNTAEQDRRARVALRLNAQQKLQRAGFRNGQSVDLIVAIKDGILEKAEAEALSGREILIETPATETEEERLVVAPPVETVPVLSDAVKPAEERVPADEDNQREKIETKHFIGEVYKDGKMWIAEITYKNGAGTEKWIAPTIRALNLKLLEGKGHGTVKVRETVRRIKYPNQLDTWDDFYKSILEQQNITKEDFEAAPSSTQNLIYDAYQELEIKKFLADYPEYYPTSNNWELIAKALKKANVPISVKNLDHIYKELMDDELLELPPVTKVVAPAPVAEVAPVIVPVTATVAADSAPAAPAASAPAAPAAAATQPVVRKRGSSGLIPGQSSAAPSAVPAATEDGGQPRELSVAELRKLPPADLKRLATKDRKYGIVR